MLDWSKRFDWARRGSRNEDDRCHCHRCKYNCEKLYYTRQDSNWGPLVYETNALPIELKGIPSSRVSIKRLVRTNTCDISPPRWISSSRLEVQSHFCKFDKEYFATQRNTESTLERHCHRCKYNCEKLYCTRRDSNSGPLVNETITLSIELKGIPSSRVSVKRLVRTNTCDIRTLCIPGVQNNVWLIQSTYEQYILKKLTWFYFWINIVSHLLYCINMRYYYQMFYLHQSYAFFTVARYVCYFWVSAQQEKKNCWSVNRANKWLTKFQMSRSQRRASATFGTVKPLPLGSGEDLWNCCPRPSDNNNWAVAWENLQLGQNFRFVLFAQKLSSYLKWSSSEI